MLDHSSRELPVLPLLLWRTPPALERVLLQEGIAYKTLDSLTPSKLGSGRFLLFDSRNQAPRALLERLTQSHAAIDVDRSRGGFSGDPFDALVDTRAGRKCWNIGHCTVEERVGRVDKAPLRVKLVEALRSAVIAAGGVWIRIAPFPHPYRSAFNLRIDLDESDRADYVRFKDALTPINECTTHFVSTAAYGDDPEVLRCLRSLDTQSHGHYHVVYRDKASNRRNLRRAHDRLLAAGIAATAFAAPEGRWNEGLGDVLEELGYHYSSEFQLAYDEWPHYPWRNNRFSNVLQIPVHPICEGLFFLAGVHDSRIISDYFVSLIQSKIAAREPAFVYGHPERRLGRYPEIVRAIARTALSNSDTWRTTLTEFARWWKRRAAIRWSAHVRDGLLHVRFESDIAQDRMALEIDQQSQFARVPIYTKCMTIALNSLPFEKQTQGALLPRPRTVRRPLRFKTLVRDLIDWETVTPIDALPDRTLMDRLRRNLRRAHAHK